LPVILFAALWFVAGFVLAVFSRLLVDLPMGNVQCGLILMVVGLIGLLPIIRTERGRRLFFEGPDEDEDTDLRIGCLWITPVLIVLIVAIFAAEIWLMSQLSG
jgi:hypothetical protein